VQKLTVHNTFHAVQPRLPAPGWNPEKNHTSIMKITALVSTTLALAAFSCFTSVNCLADKAYSDKDQRVYKLSELSSRPTPTKQIFPDMQGINRQDEQLAVVSLIIAADGTVAEAQLEQASSPQFGQAALEAAKQWEFTPGLCEGKAVRSKVTIPFKISKN
jgi:TonB family protein